VETAIAPAGNRVKLLILCAVLSAATNFPEGYCNSYPNTSYKSFQYMINGSYVGRGLEEGLSDEAYTWYWSFVLNIWFVGDLLGTFVTPYFTDNLGRKKSLLIANFCALFGAILSLSSVLFSIPELFIISRFTTSISSGMSFGGLILFLQEATPTHERGITSFVCESTFIMTTALGIGCGMDYIFGQNLPLLTGIAILPALIAIAITLPLFETPKFLLISRNDRDAALKSLEFYRGASAENEQVLDDMLIEKEMGGPDDNIEVALIAGIIEVFTTRHLRMAFILGAAALQITVGIWPIVYLSTDFLAANFPPELAQLASFGFILADFVASLLGIAFVERYNRRSLLIGFGAANTFSLCLYILADLLIPLWQPIRWGQIGALVLFGITYGFAVGPIAFFITSELVPQRNRSIVQSLVFCFSTIMNFAISFVTLPCYTSFGVLSFLPLLVIPAVLCEIFLFFYLPETRAREVN
ncbi:hypothetical protein PFISCL1PPCAC_28056, partial [Pristionchus fissidentatus]